MKIRRVRLELRPVPSSYEPGYPAQLSSCDYRRLVLPGVQRRAINLAVAAGLVIGVRAQEDAIGDGDASREERVLALVRELHTGGFWYPRTTFDRKAGRDPHAVVPSIPISFGNSMSGVFDAGRARKLGLELFGAYDLEPQADVRMETETGGAVLDGYDAARRVGFELRGRMPQGSGMFARPAEEPAEEGLDDGERRALERQGLRLHVADLGDYPLMDGDQFTPTLAWLAGIVSFLNEVTAGPDVDLSAVLFRNAQRFELPEPAELELPEGVTAARTSGMLELSVERPVTVRLAFDGGRVVRGRAGRFTLTGPERLDAPLATGGTPTVLSLSRSYDLRGFSPAPGVPHLALRLLQRGANGAADVEVSARGGTLFAPSTFDAAQPFTLELSLAPGAHRFHGPHLTVGVPER